MQKNQKAAINQTQSQPSLQATNYQEGGAAIQNNGSQPVDPNQHIIDFLQYYVQLEHPGYAVLITGEWGSGKTFYIKKKAQELFPKYIMVSLYGISSIRELEEAIFFEAYASIFDRKNVDATNWILKTVPALFKTNIPIDIKKILKSPSYNVIIFDDLERCDINLKDLIGYINNINENKKSKVILISNEEKINNSSDWVDLKEKTIGYSFCLNQNFDKAFDFFCQNINGDCKKRCTGTFFLSKKEIIHSIFESSGSKNLRILKHTMSDFCRLFMSLEDRHREHDEAMTKMLTLFFAIAFEFKSGKLSEDDLNNRYVNIFLARNKNLYESADGNKKESDKNIKISDDKYQTANLGDDILSDSTLINILIKGIVDGATIREELNNHPYFKEEPAWKTLSHYRLRSDDKVADAINKVEEQFHNREFKYPYIINIVIRHRLLISKLVAIKEIDCVVKECIEYIDDVYNDNSLILQPEEYDEISVNSIEKELENEKIKDEYNEIQSHLKEKINNLKLRSYTEIAQNLIIDMSKDPAKFSENILGQENLLDDYNFVAIFKFVDPEKFVLAFWDLNPQDQLMILKSIVKRYQAHNYLLESEKPVLQKIHEKLMSKTAEMNPLSKLAMEQKLGAAFSMLQTQEKPDADNHHDEYRPN